MSWFRRGRKKKPSKLQLEPDHPSVVISARARPEEISAARSTLESLDPSNPPRNPTDLIRGTMRALSRLAEENVRLVDERAKLRADVVRLKRQLQWILEENARVERWRREGQ